tara:strand:+ start:241 stop:483 length:243 start_codon:yes stop_codon:yes gene_type:complete
MNVDEALQLLEARVEDDIEQLTPKDRLLFWANLLEFKKAKIQRIPFLVPENDAKIIIEYEDYTIKAHASISEPVDKPEED